MAKRVRRPRALELRNVPLTVSEHLGWVRVDASDAENEVGFLTPREARRVAARLDAFANWLDAQKEKP